MTYSNAKFNVGQIVKHKLFEFRGVIIDVDPVFQGDPAWYETTGLSKPSKDQPWYHILVHDSVHRTYAAENNLEIDYSREPIFNPEVDLFFSEFKNNIYIKRGQEN